jgi:hypothetical protein
VLSCRRLHDREGAGAGTRSRDGVDAEEFTSNSLQAMDVLGTHDLVELDVRTCTGASKTHRWSATVVCMSALGAGGA